MNERGETLKTCLPAFANPETSLLIRFAFSFASAISPAAALAFAMDIDLRCMEFEKGGALHISRCSRSPLLGLRHELRLAAALGFGSGILEVLGLAADITSGAGGFIDLIESIETSVIVKRKDCGLGSLGGR